MSKIIYTNSDGTVAVVIPTGEVPVEDLPAQLGLTDYEIVEDEVIPTDRTFRNAWVKTGATVVEDLTKSKDIHRDKVRAARLPLLQAKDLEFTRAQETSADTAAIVTAKQALRDAPAAAAIDAASTADELKAAWDTSLLGNSPYV